MLHNFAIKLSKKRTVAENTVELTFSVGDAAFSFTAGQYISIEIPSLSAESVPNRCHDFSIASSPNNPREISIVFRVSKSIFKTALLDLPIGGTVLVDGPKGILALPHESSNPVFFIAGGIGIAPIMSMIRNATEKGLPHHMTLLYCNRDEGSTVYGEELRSLKKQNLFISIVFWLGAINEEMIVPYAKTPRALWYIVGSPEMVSATRKILSMHDIPDAQILTEEFSGYTPYSTK